MQNTYLENKTLWLVNLVIAGVVNMLFWGALCSAPTAPPELKFYFIGAICILLAYGYFKCRNREYWVRLDDESVKFYNSSGKGLEVYRYADIRRIENYWFGFTLKFKKGCPIQRIQIDTSSFKNGRELKEELRKRWIMGNSEAIKL